jgi:hypothetical protein
VFGIIESVLGFRQFLLRGIDNVHGEWTLGTMAWNMKRMFVLVEFRTFAASTDAAGPHRASPTSSI